METHKKGKVKLALQRSQSISGGEKMGESLGKGEDRLPVPDSPAKEGTDGVGLMRSMDSRLEAERG